MVTNTLKQISKQFSVVRNKNYSSEAKRYHRFLIAVRLSWAVLIGVALSLLGYQLYQVTKKYVQEDTNLNVEIHSFEKKVASRGQNNINFCIKLDQVMLYKLFEEREDTLQSNYLGIEDAVDQFFVSLGRTVTGFNLLLVNPYLWLNNSDPRMEKLLISARHFALSLKGALANRLDRADVTRANDTGQSLFETLHEQNLILRRFFRIINTSKGESYTNVISRVKIVHFFQLPNKFYLCFSYNYSNPTASTLTGHTAEVSVRMHYPEQRSVSFTTLVSLVETPTWAIVAPPFGRTDTATFDRFDLHSSELLREYLVETRVNLIKYEYKSLRRQKCFKAPQDQMIYAKDSPRFCFERCYQNALIESLGCRLDIDVNIDKPVEHVDSRGYRYCNVQKLLFDALDDYLQVKEKKPYGFPSNLFENFYSKYVKEYRECEDQCKRFTYCEEWDSTTESNVASDQRIQLGRKINVTSVAVEFRYQTTVRILENVQVFKEELEKTLIDLLVDFGGLLGFYFGFSVATLVHFALFSAHRHVNQKRKQAVASAKRKVTTKFLAAAAVNHFLSPNLEIDTNSAEQDLNDDEIIVDYREIETNIS